MSHKLNPLFYLLIGLAIFGLGYALITNTAQFFKFILITVGFAVILFGIFYFILNKRGSSGFSNKYKKAVKQSKRKYGNTNQGKKFSSTAKAQHKNKNDLNQKRQKRNASHLRVIEGKKDKKKNRALN